LNPAGGYYRNGRFSSFKILAAAWYFTAFVFVYIYSSCMVSYMSLTYQRPDVNTFKGLATDPNYKPITYQGISIEFMILVFTGKYMFDACYIFILFY